MPATSSPGIDGWVWRQRINALGKIGREPEHSNGRDFRYKPHLVLEGQNACVG